MLVGLPASVRAESDTNERAKTLVKAAMEQHYLGLEFREAEEKMKAALTICREEGCSQGLHARIYRYLAVVYALGLKDQDAATFAFIDMLKLGPKLRPDKNFEAPEVNAAFKAALKAYLSERAEEEQKGAERKEREAAARKKQEELDAKKRAEDEQRAEAARRASEEERARLDEEARLEAERVEEEERKKREPPPVGQLLDEPWVEQSLETPIPVFVELETVPEGQEVKKVELEWVAPGGRRGTLVLKEHETGWAGYIPCAATTEEGELSYWVTAYQQFGHPLATAGDANEPRLVFVKKALDHKQPHLPGELPPEGCDAMPTDDLVCVADSECPAGKFCDVGRCRRGKPADVKPERVANRFGLVISPDFSIVSSTEACSESGREDGTYSCFLPNGVEYEESPSAASAGSFNTFAPGTLRIALTYDRVVGERITLGGRAGATLLGHPSRNDGKAVLPFHLEGRAAYYLGKDPFAEARTRVFGQALLGLANSAGRVGGVQVRPSGEDGLDVWQKGGPLFVGLGVGIEIAFSRSAALLLDLSVRQHLPQALTTAAPTLGYVHSL